MEIQFHENKELLQKDWKLLQKYPRLYLMYNDNNQLYILKTYEKMKHAKREWSTLTALSDLPFIPKPYAVAYEQQESHLIMNYIPGIDLFEYIDKHGSFTEHTLKPVLYTLLTYLNDIHKRGIIHRDIKPENIMYVENTKSLVIIDFEGRETDGYRSPELSKEHKISVACDVWALGITCYILVSSYFPFATDVDASKKPLRCPSTWSPLFQNLIKGMLEKNPSKRSTIPALLLHPFFHKK